MNVKANLEAVTQRMYNKAVKELDDSQLYFAILNMTKDMMNGKGVIKGNKKVYYISAEFLIGKLLSNNLINLGIYEELLCPVIENSASSPPDSSRQSW